MSQNLSPPQAVQLTTRGLDRAESWARDPPNTNKMIWRAHSKRDWSDELISFLSVPLGPPVLWTGTLIVRSKHSADNLIFLKNQGDRMALICKVISITEKQIYFQRSTATNWPKMSKFWYNIIKLYSEYKWIVDWKVKRLFLCENEYSPEKSSTNERTEKQQQYNKR